MTNAPPGWYSVPDEPSSLRWWDGAQWTELRKPAGARAARSREPVPRSSWIWLLGTGAGFLVASVAFGIGAAMVMLAIFAIVVSIVGLTGRRVPWLRSPTWKLATLGAGFVLLIGGSAASAATSPSAPPPKALADLSASTSSTPTPVVTTEEETVTQPVPFERMTQEDPARDAGTTAVIQQGVDGTRTITYLVTYTDGAETERVVTSDVITVVAIPEITAIGTRQPPPPAPVAGGSGSGCDPNYAGACVPIASDVDCAGGSGNGPAYVQGPVRIVGFDIYGLDRDGDGVACDR